jgi:hypothetical protein
MTAQPIDPLAVIGYCEAATEGPWGYERVYDMLQGVIIGDDTHGAMEIPDAAFIANARTDLPALAKFAAAVLALADDEACVPSKAIHQLARDAGLVVA